MVSRWLAAITLGVAWLAAGTPAGAAPEASVCEAELSFPTGDCLNEPAPQVRFVARGLLVLDGPAAPASPA